MKKMPRPTSVDAYIAAAPRETQEKLHRLRATIRKAAPRAEEKISYGMPYYAYKGRLAYFALAKHHIGFYIPSPVIADHKNDLKEYETATGTVRFPLEKKLPLALIAKLVKARVKLNESSHK